MHVLGFKTEVSHTDETKCQVKPRKWVKLGFRECRDHGNQQTATPFLKERWCIEAKKHSGNMRPSPRGPVTVAGRKIRPSGAGKLTSLCPSLGKDLGLRLQSS